MKYVRVNTYMIGEFSYENISDIAKCVDVFKRIVSRFLNVDSFSIKFS